MHECDSCGALRYRPIAENCISKGTVLLDTQIIYMKTLSMTKKYRFNKSLQLGLAGLLSWLIVGVFTTKTQAQQSNIVPDNTG
jgi:hypothetical protein